MTITYTLEVSSARVCGFLKLLFRWRGSIYRLIYSEMLIFISLYYAVAVVYRWLLSESQKRTFEKVSWYMKDFTDLVPITFVLGFYVALIVGRWWQQYLAIPWIDRVGLHVSAFVQGTDERGRLIRRALVRYLNLMAALTFQATSPVIRARFPTLDHLEEAGLLTMEERVALDDTAAPHGNWWVPSSWFAQLAMAARKEGRIHDDLHLKSLMDEMLTFRGCCGTVWSFDWISVPLVYTQVVTISVYSFFLACLFGRQYLYQLPTFDPRTSDFLTNSTLTDSSAPSNEAAQYVVNYYIPIYTLFQFFFYMGWLKVAEEMICPYGEDDDDFELNWVMDRNVQVGYTLVDPLYRVYPKLVRDAFWDESEPEVPYTTGAANYKVDPFLGSTVAMNFETKDMVWEMEGGMETIQEEGKAASSPSKLDEEAASPLPEQKFLNSLLVGNSRTSLHQRHGSKGSVVSGADSIWSHTGRNRIPAFIARQKGKLSQWRASGDGPQPPHGHPAFHPRKTPRKASHANSEAAINFTSEFSRPPSTIGNESEGISRIHSLITLGDDTGTQATSPTVAHMGEAEQAPPIFFDAPGRPICSSTLSEDTPLSHITTVTDATASPSKTYPSTAAFHSHASEEESVYSNQYGGGWMESVDIPPALREEEEKDEEEREDQVAPLKAPEESAEDSETASTDTVRTSTSRTPLIPNS